MMKMNSARPIRVYLDSSDYSVLSDPRLQTPELIAIRTQLEEHSQSGKVEFWYSSAHIGEMGPVKWEYTDPAVARVALLTKLCGKHALIEIARFIKIELKHFAGFSEIPKDEVYSYDGNWFPSLEGLFVKRASQTDQLVDEDLREKGVSRATRRQIKRTQFKRGALRASSLVSTEAPDVSEILARLPMREQDASTISRHFLGRSSREGAERAFLASFQDPQWLMKWYYDNPDKLPYFLAWWRGPLEKLISDLKISIEGLARLSKEYEEQRNYLVLTRYKKLPTTMLSSQFLQENYLNFLSNFSRKLFQGLYPGVEMAECNESLLEPHAPGLTTLIRTLSSIMNDALVSGIPIANGSLTDAVHAMYSPYVDIFRADRHMAPIIAKHVQGAGIQVIPKLADLPKAIKVRLPC